MNDQPSTHSFKALTQYFQRVDAVDVPHTGKSYLAHGIGVYRDLKAWGWAESAARAGLFIQYMVQRSFRDSPCRCLNAMKFAP